MPFSVYICVHSLFDKALGFGYDDRTYESAIEILLDLGICQIALLTNNPEKIIAFDNSEIAVIARIPIEIEAKQENRRYLQTKKS